MNFVANGAERDSPGDSLIEMDAMWDTSPTNTEWKFKDSLRDVYHRFHGKHRLLKKNSLEDLFYPSEQLMFLVCENLSRENFTDMENTHYLCTETGRWLTQKHIKQI